MKICIYDMYIYIYLWVSDQIIVILFESLIRLSLPRLHTTFITDRGRPYTDTPVLILPGILKSSQPIGDDPNLCMALSLTYNFVRYSYNYIHIYTCMRSPVCSERAKSQSHSWSRTKQDLCILKGFVGLVSSSIFLFSPEHSPTLATITP